MTAVGHEAANLAGHPSHSLAKYTGISILGGTASGVATYQANTHLAKLNNQPGPSLSPETGGMPNTTGEGVSKAASSVRKRYTKKRKGGS